MFEYFPGHYSWNLGLLMAAQLGGEMTEIDQACRPLRELAQRPNAKDDPEAQAAWIERWSALARKVEELARRDEQAGHALTAGKKYLRASVYWFTAERMASHASQQKLAMYRAMLECFGRGARLRHEPLEFVNVPYEGTSLSALFHRAPGEGRKPVMIHFDGFDVTKEWMHLSGIAREFAARGVATLMLDHPGIGAALRLQGMPMNYDSERWAAGLARTAKRRRRRPRWRGRDEFGRILCAARGCVRETACGMRGVGRTLGECRIAWSYPARSERGALGNQLGRARALVLRRQDDR